ncbi:restriction endonuclease subunit S [Mycoplasmopsis felis]|uniref:restriction endonuclease subunit S n=2 Tax=Mycoplasmopsis felis TaxID=33923 RepID=UPI002F90C70F
MKKVLVPKVRFKGFSEDWKEERLLNFIEYKNGRAHENFVSKHGEYILVNSKFISSEGMSIKKFLKTSQYYQKNTITLVLSDIPNGKALAKTFIIPKDNTYALNQRIAGLTIKKGIDLHFINKTINRNPYFLRLDDGINQTNLNINQIKNMRFYTTDISEQQKIGKLLDQISNLITLEQSKLNKLKQLKQTLLQKMFPEHNSKKPRIRFRGFDEKWKEERLENITKRMSSGGTPSTTIKKFYNGKIPFLTISDMTKVGKYINNTEKNITPEAIENSSTWLVPKNSLLLSMYASFGKTAINKKEITTSQAILGIILNNNISVEFLYYLLFLMDINQYWYKQVETGTQPNLSNWTVSKTLIKLTKNISEQQKIGDFFSNIDTLINLYNSKLNKLKQIKEALLQKMFV